MRTDLGVHSKASADHVLAFRPCIRIQLALVAAFAAISVSFIAFGAPEMERQAKVQQESVHVVRR